jgi:O-Antigen ligase
MRVRAVQKPFKRTWLSTLWVEGTVRVATTGERTAAVLLFLASAGATLTISVRSPLAAWAYAFAALAGACWWTITSAFGSKSGRGRSGNVKRNDGYANIRAVARDAALVIIAALGVVQWITGATVYRYATLEAWARAAALVATVALAQSVFSNSSLLRSYLRAFVWFAAGVGAISVLAYFTSPGKILWIFPSPYPDTWGPFLSRNDFAAFLELAFPVAMWFGLSGEDHRNHGRGEHAPNSGVPLDRRTRRTGTGNFFYLLIAAGLLAAGFASASRAGSALLLAEAIVIVTAHGSRRWAVKFAAAAVVLIILVGAGTLIHRWGENDPMRVRREIQRSALEMIHEQPIRGYGMGTFIRVYPTYAQFDLGAVVDHAHNDWLEWAADGGIPYALAWLVVAVSVLKPAARSVWGWGVIAVFLHAFVDYPFARFGVSAWTMALIGALSAYEVNRSDGSNDVRSDMREVRLRAH